jgi:hypothetical protein
LWSGVSSRYLLTAGAVSRGHLVGVAVGVSARLGGGRGGSDALVAIMRWILDPLRSSVGGSLVIAALF